EDRARAEALGVPLVEGGASRDASVRAGLEALAGTGVEAVLIHDGARPLVSRALIDRLQAHYGLAVEIFRPDPAAVDAFEREHGLDAMYRSRELRHACCAPRPPAGAPASASSASG
ncbi:MAG: 2-C-methyl-D-erythritol 4-phosphate cytidylyltransferase, partial [Allosphingosinicella sp.]